MRNRREFLKRWALYTVGIPAVLVGFIGVIMAIETAHDAYPTVVSWGGIVLMFLFTTGLMALNHTNHGAGGDRR